MRRYSRKPAAFILLAACLLAGVWAGRRAMVRAQAPMPSLRQLELAVTSAEASPTLWLAYAQRLQEAGRFAHAVAAYRKVLDEDPISRPARVGCAVALASDSQLPALRTFLVDLLNHDPALTLEVLQLPPCRRCLGDAATAALQDDARLHLMD